MSYDLSKTSSVLASSTGGTPTAEGLEITTLQPLTRVENPVVSDTGQSYISSSIEYSYLAVDRALPVAVDDAEKKYGTDLYEKKMMLEPTCAGMDKALKIITLADGITVAPSHPAPPRTGATSDQATDYAIAAKLADYMRTVVDRLGDISDEPLVETAWNFLDGCRIGHKLGELTFDYLPGGEFKGRYGLERFVCKPRENYAFVVDQMNRFRGVVAKIPGTVSFLWQGIIYDVSQLQNAIAPEKLLNFTVDKTNGDPRGQSWWRSVYDPYYRKQLAKPPEIKCLVQYGGGMITVIAPETKAGVSVTDINTGDEISVMRAIDKATSLLKAGHHATYPYGTVVDVHQPKSDPAMFDSSFNRYDREMVQAFLLNYQAILEAKHSSKASSGEAMDLLDELKMFVRERLCSMLNRMSKRLVRMSYGPDMVKYAPTFVMQKASRPDFAANAAALGPLFTAIGPQTTNEQWDYFMVEVLGAPAGRVEILNDASPTTTQDQEDAAEMAARFPRRVRRPARRFRAA